MTIRAQVYTDDNFEGGMAPQHPNPKTTKQRLENCVSVGISLVEALGYAQKTGSARALKRAIHDLEDWAVKAAEELPSSFI